MKRLLGWLSCLVGLHCGDVFYDATVDGGERVGCGIICRRCWKQVLWIPFKWRDGGGK